MKKQNITFILIKFLCFCIISSLFWLIVFSFFTPDTAEEVISPFPYASIVFGLLTGIVIKSFIEYNNLSQRKQSISACKSNIMIMEEQSISLLEKANSIIDNYAIYETNVFKVQAKIQDTANFFTTVNSIPELQSNKNIIEFQKQIQECEENIAQFKVKYNNEIVEYNSKLNSFPIVIYKVLFRLKNKNYYSNDINQLGNSDEIIRY